MKYVKKPIPIEARQFNGLDDYLEIVKWMKEVGNTQALADEVRYETPLMLIPTLEGVHAANPGDWIIKGVRDEFYPCRGDIFEETYESEDMAKGRQMFDENTTQALGCLVNDMGFEKALNVLQKRGLLPNDQSEPLAEAMETVPKARYLDAMSVISSIQRTIEDAQLDGGD